MQVIHIPCGPFVNASEQRAYKEIDASLRRIEGDGRAYVLTNLYHASARNQPDEIDVVVIGPGGAAVIEVKHWDRASLRNTWDIAAYSELITAKAKRVAGQLRRVEPTLAFVPPSMLLTRDHQSLRRNGKLPEQPGIIFYGLRDIDALLAGVARGSLPAAALERMARSLAPRQTALAADATPRRFARFDSLKLLSPADDRFARVHAARDPATGDRVILHSYDLSAAPANLPNPETFARREFDSVQRLQKSRYLPSLVDSWQAVPNYAGELFFFTLADPAATTLSTLIDDPDWTIQKRLAFASQALRALDEVQTMSTLAGEVVVHRALTPANVRVRADGSPLFAGWGWARLPQAQTVTGHPPGESRDEFSPPEVQANGLASAGPRSDIYSLCRTLLSAAEGETDEAAQLRGALALGLEADPAGRAAPAEIAELIEAVSACPGAPPASTPLPPVAAARLWDEGYVLEWERQRYRVVSLLGQGAAGRTLKLEQLDPASGDPIGTYVGKVVFDEAIGPAALSAYRKIRSVADHRCLSTVLNTTSNWAPDTLMALLRWRRGEPLDAWRGEDLNLLAQYAGEADVETMVLRWATDLCEALEVLHAQSWVHNDISPSNILVDEGDVLLIDFDLSGPAGMVAATPGTLLYASPERRSHAPASPSDDVFALAASLFHALTGRRPFGDTGRTMSAGLQWAEGEREHWSRLAPFLDNAVDSDLSRRFETAGGALRFLKKAVSGSLDRATEVSNATDVAMSTSRAEPAPLTPNFVPRVRQILQTYPGSRFGNTETRGLDTDFAYDTYVETSLDGTLLRAVQAGEVSLVILCGNAGDGKTAFLQHLAASLGAPPLQSSDRVWSGRLNGIEIKINLDGAASFKGRSADELLDDLFAPFHHGSPKDTRAHLLAVNDGRLMEWVESFEERNGGIATTLTRNLVEALGRDGSGLPEHVRLIELNLRSLVGGIDRTKGAVQTEFVDNLIARLVGSERAPEIWAPCRTCSAQRRCPMYRSAAMMGASRDPDVIAEGALFRRRLTTALQAVHQRNEVHITARELKAAVSYILFGLHDCQDLHNDPGLRLHTPADYVFDTNSPLRQGELLRELTRLDPGLEAQAPVDRYVAGWGTPAREHGAARYPDLPRSRARRRAWFEWTDAQINAVGGEADSLRLKDGQHLAAFRDFPLLPQVDRDRIQRSLCLGLSRLERLPDIAYRYPGVVPVRTVPRTPTETAFWVEKKLERFSLEPEQFSAPEGLETLHRYLTLTYRPTSGHVERLTVTLDLYALLMDLAEGVQILDAFSDDVFANLDVFTQRLAQEDERSLRAWNPAHEDQIYAVVIEPRARGQTIVLKRVDPV